MERREPALRLQHLADFIELPRLLVQPARIGHLLLGQVPQALEPHDLGELSGHVVGDALALLQLGHAGCLGGDLLALDQPPPLEIEEQLLEVDVERALVRSERGDVVLAELPALVERHQLLVAMVRPAGSAGDRELWQVAPARLPVRVAGAPGRERRDPRRVALLEGARDRDGETQPLRAGARTGRGTREGDDQE
jgi:hypothetical protein